MRTFIYARVSRAEQTVENQVLAIKARGYDVQPQRVVTESISGGTMAMQRPLFARLVMDKMETGDRLIVLKLDRLGRDSIDVQQTITTLLSRGIAVVCLDLPIADIASAEGRLMLQMFGAFAEFERSRIVERTQEGLRRAQANGVRLGRPRGSVNNVKLVRKGRASGQSQSQVAASTGLSLSTVKRHWHS